MKKIIISLILTVMLAMLTGCVDSAAETEKRFVEISDEGTFGVSVYYDKQTKVEYAMKNNGNGKTFTDYQIETVVTKEQFQSVEYRLEE